MKKRILILTMAVGLIPLAGCLSVGNGQYGRSVPTIADEIKDLNKARRDGEIGEDDFQLGMSALGTRR